MKLKKLLLSGLSLVLVAALAIGGTVAYLQDDDSDVNVMTLGNVSIEQHEYERVVNADGTFATDTIDGVTSYVLKDFTQGKPLLPSAINTTTWEGWDWDATPVRMTQVDSYGGMQVFKSASNAQDKFVVVENTGKTDAYVRTLVAVEIGDASASLIGTSYHQTWTKNEVGTIVVDGNTYSVYEYVYNGANGTRHDNGILPAGDTAYPNFSQVYIKSAATNEDMVALDGNGNGTLDILVISQAVQVAGFDNAQTALDTAFGKSSEKAAEWFGGESFPTMVATQEQLDAAVAAGKDVVLGVGTYSISGDTEIVISGSGEGTVVDIDGNIQNATISNATVVGTNSLNVQADDSVTFTNVVFEGKVGIVQQGVVNGNATFVGCTFEGGLHIDKSAADSEIKFIDCDFGELCIIKLGGSANYSFENCVIETLDSANTSGWGRDWVISYGDISFTDCQIGRLVRAGAAINITLNSCVDGEGNAIVDDSIIYKSNGVNYNNPTVTVK